jgi:hypothetical protein
MKIKAKLMLLALTTGSMALQLWGGGCGRFWGDVVGDAWWLSVID